MSAASGPIIPHPEARSRNEIEDWLIARFAALTRSAYDTIDVDIPFADYALDSSVAVSIAAEFSAWLGRELPVTVFWEYPTIRTLAEAVNILSDPASEAQ